MKTTVMHLDENKVRVDIEASADDLKPSLDEAARQLSSDLDLPGFRRGKIPRAVLARHVGADRIRAEGIRIAFPRLLLKALETEALDVIGLPEIDKMDDADDGSLSVCVVVDVRPEVTVGSLSGEEVQLDLVLEPSEEEIGRQIDALRERFSTTEEVSRPAREGDYVLMNIEAHIHAERVEDLTRQDILYEVGSGRLLDRLDEHLDGAGPGSVLKFNETIPASIADHGGEEATFSVLVKEVREKILPEVTDDWVQEASEFDTTQELRDEITRALRAMKLYQARMEAYAKVVAAIVERARLQIPAGVLDTVVRNLIDEMSHDLSQRDITMEEYFEVSGESFEAMQERLREDAREQSQNQLVFQAIVTENNLDATESEIAEQIQTVAIQEDRTATKVRRDLESSGRLPALVEAIERGKALRHVLGQVTALDADGNPVDLVAGIGAADRAEAGMPPGSDESFDAPLAQADDGP